MPELSCPTCGTHLELGLTAVTSRDQKEVVSPAIAGAPNSDITGPFVSALPGARQHLLKGHMIEVAPYKVIEVAMKAGNASTRPSRWGCTWFYDNGTAEMPLSVRAVLMAFLLAEYPTIDWQNLGVTTNDAIRLIGQCPGFVVVDLQADGDLSRNGDFRYPKNDEWQRERFGETP